MRRAVFAFACALVSLAACGRGQDPTIAGNAAAAGDTTATTAPAVDAEGATTTVAPGDTTVGTPVPGGAAAPSGTAPETTVAAGTGVPVDDVPGDVFGPPAPGRYRFHNFGSANGQPVDNEGDTLIESLSATDIRQTAADGSQVLVLRYLADRVDLLSLDANLAGQTRHFDGPVLFAPIPPAGGWSWTLRTADGRTTAHQESQFAGRETITTPAGTFDTYRIDSTITVDEGTIHATIQLQTWVDLGLRTAVRVHQTANVPLLFQADTTSESLGFTPA